MKCKLLVSVFLSIFLFVFNTSLAQEEVTLEQVVALALEKNYDVQLAKNTLEVAEANNRYAVGAFLPQIDATAATVWNSNDQELRFQDESRTNSRKADCNNISATAQLNWT